LGVILYELLTGQLPFDGTSLAVAGKILTQTPLAPSTILPDLDPRLEAICLTAMARSVVDRFASMGALAAALTEYLRAPSTDATPATPAPAAFRAESAERYALTQLATAADRLSGRPGEVAEKAEDESKRESAIEPREAENSTAEPAAARRRGSRGLWLSLAAGLLLVGSLAALRGGVSKVKKPDGAIVPKNVPHSLPDRQEKPPVNAPDGYIVLENLPKDGEILVDGNTIDDSWPGTGTPVKIPVVPGTHKLEVKKDGFNPFEAVITVKGGDSEKITVRLEPQPDSPMIINTIGMKVVLIPDGEFRMGSPDSDKDAQADEKRQHPVRIMRPFYLGATEVTQGQYRAVTGVNPSSFKGPDELPVETVSWEDAMAFCAKLNELEKGQLRGASYRLPTEAEWEYACRAGTTTRFSFGDSDASLGEYAWFWGNSDSKTHPVGQKRPNLWGLYDMHGNVWEWCLDCYDPKYYSTSPANDPMGPSGGLDRVRRGGCWRFVRRACRAAYRDKAPPSSRYNGVGFRVARVSPRP
jgi:formylglycine-generating enzyme required for sulfatase activity